MYMYISRYFLSSSSVFIGGYGQILRRKERRKGMKMIGKEIFVGGKQIATIIPTHHNKAAFWICFHLKYRYIPTYLPVLVDNLESGKTSHRSHMLTVCCD